MEDQSLKNGDSWYVRCTLRILSQDLPRKELKNTQDHQKDTRVRMKSIKSVSKLKKKAWKYFSKYIRLKNSKNGYCQCITCGKQCRVEEMNAGHYKHGNTKPTYFDERNVHPQCVSCNMYRSGNLDQYALYLEGRYGEGILQTLDRISKGPVFKKDQLINIAEEYKEKLKYL